MFARMQPGHRPLESPPAARAVNIVNRGERDVKRFARLFVVVAACGTAAAAQAPAIPAAEQAAIVATALDYGDGFYSGAPERMERAIHPDLNKVYVQALPQTGRFVTSYYTTPDSSR